MSELKSYERARQAHSAAFVVRGGRPAKQSWTGDGVAYADTTGSAAFPARPRLVHGPFAGGASSADDPNAHSLRRFLGSCGSGRGGRRARKRSAPRRRG
jgi:hypothetical protein